jgi:hypothetical protein
MKREKDENIEQIQGWTCGTKAFAQNWSPKEWIGNYRLLGV